MYIVRDDLPCSPYMQNEGEPSTYGSCELVNHRGSYAKQGLSACADPITSGLSHQ